MKIELQTLVESLDAAAAASYKNMPSGVLISDFVTHRAARVVEGQAKLIEAQDQQIQNYKEAQDLATKQAVLMRQEQEQVIQSLTAQVEELRSRLQAHTVHPGVDASIGFPLV